MNKPRRGPDGMLRDLRIVELSAFVAVPFAGMTLAQMGADVVRIDPIGGGLDYRRLPLAPSGASLYWAGLNKGKRSVELDLASSSGRAIAKNIAISAGSGAGIVITNLAPSWLDYDELVVERPDLIMVVLEGNPDGSAAVDYTINAATGFPLITGEDAGVVNHVLPAWDVLAGSMVANAVLAAERLRTKTGQGMLVRLSLADVAFSTVAHLGLMDDAVLNSHDRPKFGNFLYGSFGRDFVTADGRRIMLVALTTRQWRSLVEVTGIEEWVSDLSHDYGWDLDDEGDRFEARERIAAVLETWVANRNYREVANIFDDNRICWGQYQSIRELAENDRRVSPSHNEMWQTVHVPNVGRVVAPGSVYNIRGADRPPVHPAPALGIDTADVLETELGLSGPDIDDLRRRGVVR